MNGISKRILAMLLPAMLVFGCSSSNEGTESGVPLSFSVIGSGPYLSGGEGRPKLVETYTDQASYDSALNTYALRVDGEVIDFAIDQVVLVTMGSRNSGGYTIAAESVKDAGEIVELNVLLSSPGADCVTTDALTHPYQVLKINSLKEVRTIERNVIESCE